MGAGPHAYFLMSLYASRMMAANGGGLIVGVTDGLMEGVAPEILEHKSSGGFQGQLLTDLAHTTINRLMYGMSIGTPWFPTNQTRSTFSLRASCSRRLAGTVPLRRGRRRLSASTARLEKGAR